MEEWIMEDVTSQLKMEHFDVSQLMKSLGNSLTRLQEENEERMAEIPQREKHLYAKHIESQFEIATDIIDIVFQTILTDYFNKHLTEEQVAHYCEQLENIGLIAGLNTAEDKEKTQIEEDEPQ